MIVTCDKCKTKYKIDDRLAGKKVRCASCGNVWRFELDAFSVTDFDEENPENTTDTDSGNANNDAFSIPPTEDQPVEDSRVSATLDEAPKNQSDVDAMFDSPTAADDAPKSQSDVDTMFDSPAPADSDASNQQSDVDNMFDSFVKKAEDEQLQAEIDTNGTKENVTSTISPTITEELDAGRNNAFLPVSDEIATTKNSEGISLLKFSFITMATIVVCALASMWFLRFELAKEFPKLADIYESIGIDVMPVGTGLDFREIVYEKTHEEDTEYLWIKGKIVNISDKIRKIPSVLLILYDNKHTILNTAVYDSSGNKLDPGKDYPFTIWAANPSQNAVEAEITFTREKQQKK